MNEILTVTSLPWVTLLPGEKAEARIGFSVAAGFHVQANPAGGRFLVPMELTFARQKVVRVGRPVYPAGETYHLEGSPDALLVYSGKFDLVVDLEAAPDMPAGDYFLKGSVRYQACDHRTCLFPASLPLVFTVEVLTPFEAGEKLAVPVEGKPLSMLLRR